LRAACQGRVLRIETVARVGESDENWSFVRRDARNTAADPLQSRPTAAPPPRHAARLRLSPNPSPGSVAVAWRDLPPDPATVEIYDLRGRRLRSLRVADSAAIRSVIWDGRDAGGRPAAAGTYLVLMRSTAGVIKGRAVIAR